ncbi:hypothetical protein CGCF415_v007587 [Colletotrichum fructicola]|nr:hypothetical protein CGCFRS4_v012594 [Colletotrichum fructicola]KAF4907131.1 hypothetical protein CGCF415_v007587 [Colletotrichum fructicola]KAF4936751.1 hypothetical protein CGCF245_v006381 [Colletotrichum fructicola]
MVKYIGADDPNFHKIINRIELFSRLAHSSFGNAEGMWVHNEGMC